jgi:hypothetical protein
MQMQVHYSKRSYDISEYKIDAWWLNNVPFVSKNLAHNYCCILSNSFCCFEVHVFVYMYALTKG